MCVCLMMGVCKLKNMIDSFLILQIQHSCNFNHFNSKIFNFHTKGTLYCFKLTKIKTSIHNLAEISTFVGIIN